MNKTNLKILPKYEDYIVYINCILVKIPKVARLSIGDELKKSMYKTLYQIYRLIYVEKESKIFVCNEIDALFSYQRAVIRSMYDLRYIDIKKKTNCIKMLGELGMMLGGYIKSVGVKYAKNV